MSLWPVRVHVTYETQDETIITINYDEFREWNNGVDLNDATDEQITEFLQAGDELYTYGWNAKVRVVDRNASSND